MLSIVVYGRNDNHGYNYHKRLAISLNCIAETLSDPSDEIIFADYNSPDDFPTIVEAIQDTLTPKTKKHLRILRIRTHHHERKKTHLSVLETVSRNAAICRSNPENKWILSTNPDMIFVPSEPTKSLTSLIEALPDGFYLLPRFSLPESFWELSLDRLSPKENIDFLRDQSAVFHLKTTVRRQGFLKYDNPGDFQLMLRNDIFQIGGFDEEMVKGWHVDSNLCKRMALLGRAGKSLENELIAFHCDHNRKESLVHQRIDENDWERFISQVNSAVAANPNWGLQGEEIEEIRLKTNPHIFALSSALSHAVKSDYVIDIHLNSFNTLIYVPARVFAGLADHLCHLPRTIDIAYIGHNIELLNLCHKYLKEKGFSGKILCLNGFLDGKLPSSVVLVKMRQLIAQSYLFICDFGIDANFSHGREAYPVLKKRLKNVMKSFLDIVRQKKAQKMSGKFIGINVLHTDFNCIFSKDLLIRNNGHSTGISYGFLPINRKVSRRKMSSMLQYCVVRYFYNYSDTLRSFLARTKLTKKLFKSLR
jgi:hypothetical protein